jgi:hypothetical protein
MSMRPGVRHESGSLPAVVALTVLPSAFPSTDENPWPTAKTVSATWVPGYHVRAETFAWRNFTESATFMFAHPTRPGPFDGGVQR